VACIVAFPRFTFKKSGADVSASVVILEKREKPLLNAKDSDPYPIYVNLLQSVGWDIGVKGAKKIYRRDLNSGVIVLDDENNPVIDADFDEVVTDLKNSPVLTAFPWLAGGNSNPTDLGWAVSSDAVFETSDLMLDPKRLCRKYRELVASIVSGNHYTLSQVCRIVPERSWKRVPAKEYQYVELQSVSEAMYMPTSLKGWELPSRAKHVATPGDLFVGSIWGSVGKWFIAGADATSGDLVVTNGFYRLQIIPGMEHALPDLVLALGSESYRVQMRAMATGSDGLAEISPEDLKSLVFPAIDDAIVRAEADSFLLSRRQTVSALKPLVYRAYSGSRRGLIVAERRSHFGQV
jgi:type I restriction enzyme M protein